MHASILLLSLLPATDVHVDELRGFEIDVPDGWSSNGQEVQGTGFVLNLQPPGSVGHEGVAVTVMELSDGAGLETLLEKTRERVESDPELYSDFEEWKGELGGQPAPTVGVNYSAPTAEYRIVQAYAEAGDVQYIVRWHAQLAEFEEKEDSLEAVVDSFALVEVSEESRAERALLALAKRCGSEVNWAASWEEAAQRARKRGRLVLVTAFLIPGFDITDTPRTSTFMDPDVIELVNERFVPLWYKPGMDAPFVRSYGMSATTFGQALLLVTPDGEVLRETQEASSADVAYAFLLSGLPSGLEQDAGAEEDLLEGALDRIALAEQRIARGELDRALEQLEGEESAAAHRLRARVHRLRRQGDAALQALAQAREAGGAPEAELWVEEAELLMRAGRDDEANAALERVIEDHPEGEAFAHARFIRGLMDLRERDRESAAERWRALATEQPDSRWAWQAAAALQSTGFEIDLRPDFGWPDEDELRALLTPFESTPVAPDRARAAADDALAWLLESQRANGSFPVPGSETKAEGLGPNPFVDAITAIAGRALLGQLEQNRARQAAERALEFLQASVARREETPPLVLFMDYQTWSDSMMLQFLAESVEADLTSKRGVKQTVAALLEDLESRQRANGGWSYYVTPDLDGADAPSQSISFTTAAAVLALARVQEVGLAKPREVQERAVEALTKMRSEDGIFAYFLYDGGQASASTAPAGAVGRGPACELALYQAGQSSADRLRLSLDLFLEHAPLFDAERGKVLMHAGPDGQGCHYLFFDYAHAALSEAALAANEESRTKLLELILDCRQPDGSFLDTPLMGRAYGTAMALIAIDALEN